MNELRILRGRDVRLFADEEELFGVTAVTASEKYTYHEIREYLSSEAYDRVRQDGGYQIKLTVLSLFDRQLVDLDGFTLSIRGDDTRYAYENCRVLGVQYTARGDKNAEAEFLLEADKFEIRGTDDD